MKFLVILALGCLVASFAQEEEDGDDYETFQTFLHMNGMAMTKLTPGDGGIGMVATENIKKGERLASIPKKIKMDTTTPSSISNVLAGLQSQGLDQANSLALYLLFEKHRSDDESYWAPYIDTLPTNYSHVPLFWSKDEQTLLAGSAQRLLTEQLEIVDMMDDAVKQLTTMHPEYFDRNDYTRDEVMWAIHTVASRMWPKDVSSGGLSTAGDVPCVLMPFGDLLRRSSESGVVISSSKAGRVILTADRDYISGEEVFLHHPTESAAKVLFLTGETLAENESYAGLNYIPSLDPDDLFSHTSYQLLKNARCFQELGRGRIEAGKPIPARFIECMRIVMLTPQEYARIAQFEEDSGEAWPAETLFSLENECNVLGTLARALKGSLEAFRTTSEEDADLLAGGELSENGRKAVELRVIERKLVEHGVQQLEGRWLELLYEHDAEAEDEGSEEEPAAEAHKQEL